MWPLRLQIVKECGLGFTAVENDLASMVESPQRYGETSDVPPGRRPSRIRVAEMGKSDLGAWARRRRRELSMTAGDLAKAVGRSTGWVSLIENGRREPSKADLERLEGVLGDAPGQRDSGDLLRSTTAHPDVDAFRTMRASAIDLLGCTLSIERIHADVRFRWAPGSPRKRPDGREDGAVDMVATKAYYEVAARTRLNSITPPDLSVDRSARAGSADIAILRQPDGVRIERGTQPPILFPAGLEPGGGTLDYSVVTEVRQAYRPDEPAGLCADFVQDAVGEITLAVRMPFGYAPRKWWAVALLGSNRPGSHTINILERVASTSTLWVRGETAELQVSEPMLGVSFGILWSDQEELPWFR